MMSNPPSASQQQQKLHRRQNSTPVAFEAMKVPTLPHNLQRQNTHRRGQSVDHYSPTRRMQPQSEEMVSNTNTGSIQPGQQILRETQQQRTSRPGQQLLLPSSPQCGFFSPTTFSPTGAPYENSSTMNAFLPDQAAVQYPHVEYFSPNMNMPESAGLDGMELYLDENYPHNIQGMATPTHSVGSNAMNDRRLSHPDLQLQTGFRPITPAQQVHSSFPLTPATTPYHHRQTAQQMYQSRSLQASPVTRHLDEIKSPQPISMRRGRSLQGIVESDERHDFDATPISLEPSRHIGGIETADMPVPHSYTTQNVISTFDEYNASQVLVQPSLTQSSFEQPTIDVALEFFDETGGEIPQLDNQTVPVLTSSRVAAGSVSPSRPALSPRRMSISDLNLEVGISASIEETNITLDDIAQFIEGPDPGDNKWICKYEDCNKKFGRKENIKSHVQTHLGDRQFRCDHCKKCFVRGHDLKRHAKIHTGSKPYPCACGNSFARHDALTRHRQRGMCIGAFDGVVKKNIKRGRPRKHRPEIDDRLQKSTRTRQKNQEQGTNYASSSSSCSMSSWGSPPTETMDNLSLRGQSPFDGIGFFAGAQSHMAESVGLPPDMFSFTPPASPGYSTGNKPSPSHRSLTPTELYDLPALPPMPANLHTGMIMQQSQSLPSLSHSSSSPAADVVAFDFSHDPVAQVQRIGLKMDSERSSANDFDNFLDYSSTDLGFNVSTGSGNADDFFASL